MENAMKNTAKKRPPALLNRNEKLALIHLARKETGITGEAYRLLLEGAAGVRSAADIMWEDQFSAVMNAFLKLGFTSWKRQGKTTSRPRWTDTWGCSADQRAKIEAMWKTCARNPGERVLRAFVKRIAHVDSPAFLRPDLARKVILALADMMVKAGFDPATGGRVMR